MREKPRFYWNGKRFVPSGTTVLPKPYLAQWAANCAVDFLLYSINQLDKHDKARTAFLQESTEAADYGTYIHALCEYVLKTGIKIEFPAICPQCRKESWRIKDNNGWALIKDCLCDCELTMPHEMTQKFMDGFWKWKNKNKVKVIAMEHEVVTDTYGGRLDLVCELNGVITLVDFKTGKSSYYETWKYQLAGYRQAWNNPRCFGDCDNNYRNHMRCEKQIQSHGILKFNKETMKVNYKDFNEYQTTRTNPETKEKEKYTRTYETDRATFNALVKLWWLANRGI